MPAFDPSLLSADPPDPRGLRYSATLRAHGEYMPLAFVVRLSPLIHQTLSGLPNSGVASVGFERALAFSTLLHETVHWWQHIGSTYGLMSSLSYPVRAHGNHKQIKKLIELGALEKSVWKLAEKSRSGPSTPDTVAGLANIIVNNYFDLSAFTQFTYTLKSAKEIASSRMFENLGHAMFITYANNLVALSAVDKNFTTLPDPRTWEEPFAKLKNEKVEGFYYGSPVALWPVGAREILEGQACFSQMQYLHFGSGGKFEWDDFRDLGILHGVYEAAFKEFLERTELGWPPSINHPTVGLFMLLCDMAMNPGAGFPFDPYPHFPNFYSDTIPGIRFTSMARTIKLKLPQLLGSVTSYTKEKYQEVSDRISEVMLDPSPTQITARCDGWAKGPMSFLMEEYRTYNYGPENNAIRVLLSHFLAFCQDKLETPEIFCWPGAHMAGKDISQRTVDLFEKHGALFVDREEDTGIYPRIREGYSEAAVQKVFDDFYAQVVTYEMADQLIMKPGPFRYEYDWLKPSATPGEFKEFADRQFKAIYGIAPEDIPIV
jgi:hypothetical protein